MIRYDCEIDARPSGFACLPGWGGGGMVGVREGGGERGWIERG